MHLVFHCDPPAPRYCRWFTNMKEQENAMPWHGMRQRQIHWTLKTLHPSHPSLNCGIHGPTRTRHKREKRTVLQEHLWCRGGMATILRHNKQEKAEKTTRLLGDQQLWHGLKEVNTPTGNRKPSPWATTCTNYLDFPRIPIRDFAYLITLLRGKSHSDRWTKYKLLLLQEIYYLGCVRIAERSSRETSAHHFLMPKVDVYLGIYWWFNLNLAVGHVIVNTHDEIFN